MAEDQKDAELEYSVTWREAPRAVTLTKSSSAKNLYASWTSRDGQVKLTKLSSNPEEAKEYEDDGLVVSKWFRFSGETSGCTKIGPFDPTHNLFLLTVEESSLGTPEITELFVMSSIEIMCTYIQKRFLDFIQDDRCGLCEPTEKELADILSAFVQTGKTYFSECGTYYDFNFVAIAISG